MKILEFPFSTMFKCNCGCKFEIETNDIKEVDLYNDGHMYRQLTVDCPCCKYNYVLMGLCDRKPIAVDEMPDDNYCKPIL